MKIAGVDEVGRGPLAGPVTTAAVILPEKFDLPGLTDSKKLSARRRENLAIAIKEQAVCWSLGEACLLYTSPSPRDGLLSRMPSSA